MLIRWFNIFDFGMIVATFVVLAYNNTRPSGAGVGGVRMLRLLLRNLRLLTFIKNVPTLRSIVSGLLNVSASIGNRRECS